MVKELKSFIVKVEHESTFHDIISFQRPYSFFTEAWASQLNCFYGGWPSSLVKQGQRQYCSNPKLGSPLYPKSGCAEGEMSCQPLLFGAGLCVPSKTAQQRQSAFKYCENAFQKKGGSYDYVNHWGPEQKNQFQQLMDLAHKICVSGEFGVQKTSGMCKNLWNKMSQFQLEKYGREKASLMTGSDVCADEVPTNPETQKNIEDVLKATRKIASDEKNRSTDPHAVYRALKLDFETSPYCDPSSQYDEKGKQHMFFSGVGHRMRALQPQKPGNHQAIVYDQIIGELFTHFDLDESAMPEFGRTLSQLKSSVHGSQDFLRASRYVQAILMDQIYQKVKDRPILRDRYIHMALQEAGVIELNDQDQVICPFVDEETFVKAFKGYTKLEGKIKKPILTIVDYTKPSNQRRMYIIDMKKGEILGNTWVSHGMGDGSQAAGKDGKGSAPEVSNTANSQLSSAGFIMTAESSVGKEWGENIILKGLEAKNSNIQKRAIIIHGFRTQPQTPSMSDEEFDLFDRWENAKSLSEKAELVWEFRTMNVRPFIDATYGCLGVARHPTIDRATGKTVDQLDYLRSKINNGSLIYSHAAEDQTSDYY